MFTRLRRVFFPVVLLLLSFLSLTLKAIRPAPIQFEPQTYSEYRDDLLKDAFAGLQAVDGTLGFWSLVAVDAFYPRHTDAVFFYDEFEDDSDDAPFGPAAPTSPVRECPARFFFDYEPVAYDDINIVLAGQLSKALDHTAFNDEARIMLAIPQSSRPSTDPAFIILGYVLLGCVLGVYISLAAVLLMLKWVLAPSSTSLCTVAPQILCKPGRFPWATPLRRIPRFTPTLDAVDEEPLTASEAYIHTLTEKLSAPSSHAEVDVVESSMELPVKPPSLSLSPFPWIEPTSSFKTPSTVLHETLAPNPSPIHETPATFRSGTILCETPLASTSRRAPSTPSSIIYPTPIAPIACNSLLSTAHQSICITEPDTGSVDLTSSGFGFDDERGIVALRSYHELRNEAEDTVAESRRIWPDTPFSLYALQAFSLPKNPEGMQTFLQHSVQSFGHLPPELRPRRVRSHVQSRASPYLSRQAHTTVFPEQQQHPSTAELHRTFATNNALPAVEVNSNVDVYETSPAPPSSVAHSTGSIGRPPAFRTNFSFRNRVGYPQASVGPSPLYATPM
ncbi:hypothetical protein MVEN_02267200 [Mycena venus]|uniref:Transmembrane protein n=1 Tax=Mycena venus TaxID=2733690 RepID=A0A8H6X4L8_9AGAR|nr:hypothetical protein MVEN_02267200 [Mycena venus]